MAKNNKAESYWERRSIELEEKWNTRSRETIEKELAAYYRQALQHIQKDIEALYGTFSKDNKVSMTEARKILQGDEYRVWRMDIKEYIREIEKLAAAGAVSKSNELLRELNTLAMRSRITRLDKLYAETLAELGRLAGKTEAGMDKFLTDAYKDGYYRNLYEIGKKAGLKSMPSKVDSSKLENVLRTPWSGKNYSQRIWGNDTKLGERIKETITQGIHRGSSIGQLSRQLADRMGVGFHDAERLVRTELNYVQNKAALEGIKDAGMGFYRFVATLDNRTTPKCISHDGHVFPVEEASPGDNMPPLHARCRSTICASLGEDTSGKRPKGGRIARNQEGKNIHVPQDMRYEDWKRVHIDHTMKPREFGLKMNEEAAYKAHTDKNFGFRRKKQTDMSWADELKLVNPNYSRTVGTDIEEYTHNCQRCVMAYEARMRGFDVEAMPHWGKLDDMGMAKNWLSVFDYKMSDVVPISGSGDAARYKVAEIMKAFGPGSRAIVRVAWDEKNGHVFIAEQSESGITRFMDPQTGETAAGPKHFDLSVAGRTFIIRVDNLPFTDKIKKCCRNRP